MSGAGATLRRLRRLGNIERGCWLIAQTAPMNVLSVAQVRGRLDHGRLPAALAAIQARHPLLRVCVREDGGRPAYFESDAPIPLGLRERRDDTAFHQVVAEERNRPLPADQAPLLRLTVLWGEEASDLIFTLHHLISDGASSSLIVRDLLQALAEPAAPQPSLPLQPSLEALMPAAERGLPGLARTARFVADQAHTFWVRRPRLLAEQQAVPRLARRSAVAHQTIDREALSALRAACRARGVTLHGALCAALLLAVGAEVRDESGEPAPLLGCCSPMNLRGVLVPPVGEDLGLFVGPIVTFHRVPAGCDLFSLAAELTRDVHAARAAGVPTQALAAQSRLLPPWVSPRQAAAHLYNRLFGTVSVTNMGAVDIPLAYGDLRLTALHIGGSNNPFGSLISIGATTLDGQLFLNFNYNRGIVSDERIARVVAATLAALQPPPA